MFILDGEPISLSQLRNLSRSGQVCLSDRARERMIASRQIVEDLIAQGKVIYGINTGFGKLADVEIATDSLAQLQLNLVRSHAVGFGALMNREQARALMILRANVLAKGFSGARTLVVQKLIELINADIVAAVPSCGSVGASGDLSPLAHLALVLIGEGRTLSESGTEDSFTRLARAGIEPLKLEAKEGLALLNGTQAMLAVGGLALESAMRLAHFATYSCAMTTEGLLGTPVAFEDRIHRARGQDAQQRVAARLYSLIEGSEIRHSHEVGDRRIQDPYCIRCAPQVHGAALEALEFATKILERETGAATDNPLVFIDSGDVISGGNFHGAPVAVALDTAAVGIVQMMSIIERRIDRLVSPGANEGLPAFLASNPGLESGFMMLHVSVAAALNEARILAHPACVDNTPTSGGKEDHVSMGMTAANKLQRITDLFAFIVATECAVASQALSFREPLRPTPSLERFVLKVKERFPRLISDRATGAETENLGRLLIAGDFDEFLI